MTSLRDLWIAKGYTSTSLAAACTITPATLYRMNRKEPVQQKNIICICRVLDITIEDYNALERCARSDQFK